MRVGSGFRLGLALAASLAVPALAQESGSIQVDETTLALKWLQGRFKSPVTCMRADGSRVELTESIVVRPGPPQSGLPVLRATFFGIDLPDAAKCFNVVEPRVPDRRGVLYLTYRSHNRTDMGINDFRRTTRKGKIRYHIIGGELQIRPVGDPDRPPQVIHFEGRDFPMVVRPVLPQSDGDKLLAVYDDWPDPVDPRRRLRFEIEGPEGFHYGGAFIEDGRRWR